MATGLIENTMRQADAGALTPEMVREKTQMPPELQDAYDRVVLAGMKVMFSKETRQIVLKEMKKKGSIAKRLGEGVAGVMLILVKESNNTLPPPVVIPAGIELVAQAADALNKIGSEKVTTADIGDAMEIFIMTVLEKFGADPKRIRQAVSSFDNTAVKKAVQEVAP